MCTTYNNSQDENAMLKVFICLLANNTGYEIPTYVTYALKCVCLQVINIGFGMPIYM